MWLLHDGLRNWKGYLIMSVHQIQQTIQGLTPEQISNAEFLLDFTMKAWEEVCDENESQKHLVTDAQWDQWVTYKSKVLNDLTTITQAAYDGDSISLSNNHTQCLLELLRKISSAAYKPKEDLEAELEAQAAAAKSEEERLAQEKTMDERERMIKKESIFERIARLRREGQGDEY